MLKLKELRLENGLKRSELARKLNLPQSTIANYENETRQAPYNILITLAEFFEVSVDYLLGRTDDFKLPKEISLNDALLSANERELISLYRASSNLGKSRIHEYAELIKTHYKKEL